MSNLTLPNDAGDFNQWVKDCFAEIEKMSYEDVAEAVADFSTTGTLTERRTIDAGAATLAQLRDFVCTLVSDIQKQGQKRSYAG